MNSITKVPRESRWSVFYLLAALAVLAALVAPPEVYAAGSYVNTWNNIYPNSTSADNAGCQLCHAASTQNLNPYGEAICSSNAGNIGNRIQDAENADSDGDPTGSNNITEIANIQTTVSSQPGWTTSTVPTFNRGNCNPTGNTENAPGNVAGLLDPQPAANDPNIAVAPTTLAFGIVNVGNSNTLTTTITNNGTADLDVTGLNLSGTTEFALGTAPTTPFTVAPNATADVDMVYTPADNGPDTGSLTIASNDPDSPTVTVTLTGTGNDPQNQICNFSVAPTSLAFGGVTVGGNSTLSTTVTNNGAAACSITASVTSASGEFTLASGPEVTVPANGGTASVSVAYAPSAVGADSGSLNLASNDANNPQNVTVPLSGTGVDNNVPPPDVDCNGELNIESASYSSRRDRVRVQGTGGQRDAGDFVLLNAFDLTQILDTGGSEEDDEEFDLRGSNPDPVPCVVRVEQPGSGRCAIAEVNNAPEDCAPTGPVDPPQDDQLTARGDTYATPVGNTLTITASRVSGVLYNDFGGVPPLTAQLVSEPSAGSLDAFGADGSFTYTPGGTMVDNQVDSFTYEVVDANGDTAGPATVTVQTLSKQVDFKITMNYELGMHCTGFEFAYCCVLPPYNSIIAQVIKPAQGDAAANEERDFVDGFPRLLEGDPNVGLDGLNRETVVRDWDHNANQFRKYQLRYYHDAQPRQEGNTSKPNTSTLISAAEGNSLQYFNTVFDSAQPDGGNALVYGPYNGYNNVIQGSGVIGDVPTDNYANGWLNHFYIYGNLEGHDNTGLEADKVRLGVAGQVEYPADSGAALQPLGPTGNGTPFENVLTFSADTGTVVFTQAKVLEDLPIMLTSPRIWEALGLPLTPFEDTIDFFGDPGAVDEDAVRPYVAMKASLHEFPSGNAVTGSNGQPVIGFGTAPIDIPNCERCHSAPSVSPDTGLPNVNSPNWNRTDASYPHGGPLAGTGLEDMTNLEYNFWLAYYDIVPGVDSDWYARLKGAAINMLTLHDFDVGTSFTANYAGVECSTNPDPTDPNIDPASYACSFTNGLADLDNQSNIPQNTRLGAESVICQRCHADNVIANVRSGTFDAAGQFPIKPISEAIHNQHRNVSEGGVIVFNDSLGRDGGCQGCHPAHRSDGVMDDYPITLDGDNANADGDNRLNLGGCFVGRDVHSNPMKDVDGAETPSHMNAVGDWLLSNVAFDQGDARGIWCTNCHTQLGQEMWRTEDCNDLIHGDCLVNPRAEPTLADVAAAVGLNEQEAIDMLDPKVAGFDRTTDQTHRVWDPATPDANVATIEVDAGGNPVVTTDADGDISVNILSFCTTDDCVDRINANKADQSQWRYPANAFIDPVNNSGFPVPFSAATDGRDHWLSAGEPHCADCHKAPYVEQSGNITAYPPFNYPAKASLMRYTRGHQDISCQGCHESIHGLYPVTPAVDTTSYAQAAALNNDGSHGPLKCESCHTHVDANGIPTWVDNLRYNDPTTPGNDNLPVAGNFDRAVSWMHTYTAEADPAQDVCRNCHGPEVPDLGEEVYLEHSMDNRVSRLAMDNAERAVNNGQVFGSVDPLNTVCEGCHGDERDEVSCNDGEWRRHLIEGRVAESVWENVSVLLTGSTCGW